MTQKIVVGLIDQGLRTDLLPFNIDNNSFPTLINAYQWRGRIKRKRGTSPLGRLTRFFNSTILSYSSFPTVPLVAGSINLFTAFLLQSSGNIVPGTVTIVDVSVSQTYTDLNEDGSLQGSLGGTGTIIYATGVITITSGGTDSISAIFTYYPGLPVMGLEDYVSDSTQFPGTIAFDTTYSYNWLTVSPYPNYDVSFYKNPAASSSLPGYVPKSVETPTTWNGENYQQFWTTNYQGSLWATNGIDVPYTGTTIGMQFAPANTITYMSNTATTLVVSITNCPLVIGDFVFINEWTGTNAITLNFQSGYVTAVSPNTPPLATKTVTITLPNATLGAGAYTPGIIQYLTNRSNPNVDCLRFYDGDPTNGNVTNPSLTGTHGWVNFSPPLSQGDYTISDLPAEQYYLVGARMIVPFKDRLLFLGPVVQTSASGSTPIYLQDTVIFSQNGTPYYTASFTGNPVFATTVFNPILVPDEQTATAPAYWEDQTGFGGFQSAGIDQPLITVSANQDVLITGFNTVQAKLVYTGNDIAPFNFFIINSDLGSSSTFSSITMDQGVISRGLRGYIVTGQEEAKRIDLPIPDQVFEIDLTHNGNERFCSQRDFINEWIYFTYPSNTNDYTFNNQTLQFNYRDNSWAVFNECYTTYGQFRKQTGFTWQTVGLIFPSWSSWNQPWNAGSSTLLNPKVIAGNQQGFVVERDDGTGEAPSLSIQSISGNIVTCLNHTLNQNDYIVIGGCIGSIGSILNGQIFSILTVIDDNNFTLNPAITPGALTYFGGGVITRIYVPQIQTKQFQVAWDMGRKTRIGKQQYLFTTTQNSQITLQIFLSQNSGYPYNALIPNNDSLIYSQVLYTCPESTNLGLTQANINLQIPTAQQQEQTWHRMNTSLIGDTVQIGFTLSDAQIRDLDTVGSTFDITNATQTFPCVLTTVAEFEVGQLIQIQNVVGMTQLNGNIYQVISSNSTSVTIDVDSSGFTAYISGGTANAVAGVNAFSEIEFHGCVILVSPSQLLV